MKLYSTAIDVLRILGRFYSLSVYLVARLGIWRGDLDGIPPFRLSLYPRLRWRLDAREWDWPSCHEMLRESKKGILPKGGIFYSSVGNDCFCWYRGKEHGRKVGYFIGCNSSGYFVNALVRSSLGLVFLFQGNPFS